jgi:hypothetical protein
MEKLFARIKGFIKQRVEGDGSGEFVLLARTVAQSSRLLLHLHVCSSLFFLNNQSRVLSFFFEQGVIPSWIPKNGLSKQ